MRITLGGEGGGGRTRPVIGSDEGHPRWSFLRVLYKTRTPLARQTLVARCIADRSLLDFLFESVRPARRRRASSRCRHATSDQGLVALPTHCG